MKNKEVGKIIWFDLYTLHNMGSFVREKRRVRWMTLRSTKDPAIHT